MKTKEFNKIKPYCYVLIKKSNNKKYYGVRSRNVTVKRSAIVDSSKYPSSGEFREEYLKNPKKFKFILRWTFSSLEEAQEYERKITKILIRKNQWNNWINKSSFPLFIITENGRRMKSANMKGGKNHFFGKTHTKKTKRLISKLGKLKKVSEERKKRYSIIFQGKGNGMFGKTHSETARNKISIAARKRVMSKETKQKISLAISGSKNGMFGKKHSKNAKRRISEINTGKKRSKKTKLKLSLATRGKKNGMFGKTHSFNARRKISIAHKRMWTERRKHA